MQLPRVVIIGRPNVGKSSLLNVFAGERIAIVDPTAGITRDRIAVEITAEKGVYELVDTGGIGIVDRDDLEEAVEKQIHVAVELADLILFVTDGKTGLNPYDQVIADRLRAMQAPSLLLVNKIDAPAFESNAYEFSSLGLGTPLAVSAKQKRGLVDLKEAIEERIPESGGAPPKPVMRIALLGRRNVGKSTFLNAIAKNERVIVSEVPGTTRDAVDVRVQYKNKELMVIDTAGMRRAKQVSGSVDFYSQSRTLRAIRRSHVAFLFLDAAEEIVRLDKKIASMIVEASKPCVILLNKWDLVQQNTRKTATSADYEKYIADHLRGLHFAPFICLSAKEKLNVFPALDVAFSLFEQAGQRVGTSELNKFLQDLRPPRQKGRKKPKLYFASQVDVEPPVFIFFVNERDSFPPVFRRYVANQLRSSFSFPEIPLKLIFKNRESKYG